MAKLYKLIEENEFVSLLLNTTDSISLKGAKALYQYFAKKKAKFVEIDMMYIAGAFKEYKNWMDFKDSHPFYRNINELMDNTDVITWSSRPTVDGFIIEHKVI